MRTIEGFVFHHTLDFKKNDLDSETNRSFGDEVIRIFGHSYEEKYCSFDSNLIPFENKFLAGKMAKKFWEDNNQILGNLRVAKLKLDIFSPEEYESLFDEEGLIVFYTDNMDISRLLGPNLIKSNLSYCNGVAQELKYNGIVSFNSRAGISAFELASYSASQITRQGASFDWAYLAKFYMRNEEDSNRIIFYME
jgi:hypothetical protein